MLDYQYKQFVYINLSRPIIAPYVWAYNNLRTLFQRLMSTICFRRTFLRSDIRQISIVAEVFFFGLICSDFTYIVDESVYVAGGLRDIGASSSVLVSRGVLWAIFNRVLQHVIIVPRVAIGI